eukprot:6399869-Pyramimonas_sp.AAC.1
MGSPERFTFPTLSACFAEGHEGLWIAARAAMGATSNVNAKWQLFMYQAEWNIADAMGPSVRAPQ